MKIREEIEELKRRIKKNIDSPNKEHISVLMKQAFSVCEALKAMLKTSSLEDRKKIMDLMKEFREFISSETARMASKAGMSQEEFAKRHEDPANFSKTEWEAMQRVKGAFSKHAEEIKGVLKKKKREKVSDSDHKRCS